jgi:hypothetical protein
VAAVSDFKNLQSLEVCSGFITDAGVKNIKDLKAMRLLNLSQNRNLTDKTLELISGTCSLKLVLSIHLPVVFVSTVASRAGLTALMSLNVSNSRVSNSGLHHLKPLQNLRSLTLESCRVTAPEIKKLQLDALPNLVSVRPE